MVSDFFFVLGLLVLALAVPQAISAFASSGSMRRPALFFAVGGSLVAWASATSPNGYRAEEIPQVVMRVIADIIR
jgi:hypothetical protein